VISYASRESLQHPLLKLSTSILLINTQAKTGDYGGAYFGDGLPNTDLQFML